MEAHGDIDELGRVEVDLDALDCLASFDFDSIGAV